MGFTLKKKKRSYYRISFYRFTFLLLDIYPSINIVGCQVSSAPIALKQGHTVWTISYKEVVGGLCYLRLRDCLPLVVGLIWVLDKRAEYLLNAQSITGFVCIYGFFRFVHLSLEMGTYD